jgi:hypothetical protein
METTRAGTKYEDEACGEMKRGAMRTAVTWVRGTRTMNIALAITSRTMSR